MVVKNLVALLLLLACVTQIVSGLTADSEKVIETELSTQESSGVNNTSNFLRKSSIRSEPDPELHTLEKKDSGDSIVFVEREDGPVSIPLAERRYQDFEYDDTSIITPDPSLITPAVWGPSGRIITTGVYEKARESSSASPTEPEERQSLWTPSLGSIYQILQRTGSDISDLAPVSSWWPAPDINETIPLPEQEKIDELIKKKEEEENNNEDTTSYLAYATNGVLVLLDVPLVAGHSLIAQFSTDSPDGTGDTDFGSFPDNHFDEQGWELLSIPSETIDSYDPAMREWKGRQLFGDIFDVDLTQDAKHAELASSSYTAGREIPTSKSGLKRKLQSAFVVNLDLPDRTANGAMTRNPLRRINLFPDSNNEPSRTSLEEIAKVTAGWDCNNCEYKDIEAAWQTCPKCGTPRPIHHDHTTMTGFTRSIRAPVVDEITDEILAADTAEASFGGNTQRMRQATDLVAKSLTSGNLSPLHQSTARRLASWTDEHLRTVVEKMYRVKVSFAKVVYTLSWDEDTVRVVWYGAVQQEDFGDTQDWEKNPNFVVKVISEPMQLTTPTTPPVSPPFGPSDSVNRVDTESDEVSAQGDSSAENTDSDEDVLPGKVIMSNVFGAIYGEKDLELIILRETRWSTVDSFHEALQTSTVQVLLPDTKKVEGKAIYPIQIDSGVYKASGSPFPKSTLWYELRYSEMYYIKDVLFERFEEELPSKHRFGFKKETLRRRITQKLFNDMVADLFRWSTSWEDNGRRLREYYRRIDNAIDGLHKGGPEDLLHLDVTKPHRTFAPDAGNIGDMPTIRKEKDSFDIPRIPAPKGRGRTPASSGYDFVPNAYGLRPPVQFDFIKMPSNAGHVFSAPVCGQAFPSDDGKITNENENKRRIDCRDPPVAPADGLPPLPGEAERGHSHVSVTMPSLHEASAAASNMVTAPTGGMSKKPTKPWTPGMRGLSPKNTSVLTRQLSPVASEKHLSSSSQDGSSWKPPLPSSGTQGSGKFNKSIGSTPSSPRSQTSSMDSVAKEKQLLATAESLSRMVLGGEKLDFEQSSVHDEDVVSSSGSVYETRKQKDEAYAERLREVEEANVIESAKEMVEDDDTDPDKVQGRLTGKKTSGFKSMMRLVGLPVKLVLDTSAVTINHHVRSKPLRPTWPAAYEITIRGMRTVALAAPRSNLETLQKLTDAHVPGVILPDGILHAYDLYQGERPLLEWVWPEYLTPNIKKGMLRTLKDVRHHPEFRQMLQRVPVIFHIHGGAYCFCSAGTLRYTTYTFAKLSNAVVVSVDYRRAPKAVWPAQLEDALTGYREVVEMYGIPESNIVATGDSCGAGLISSLLLALRKHPTLRQPRAACLMSPWVDLSTNPAEIDRSGQDNADFDYLPADYINICARAVAGSYSREDPELATAFADWTDCCPLYIQVYQDRCHTHQHFAMVDPLGQEAMRRAADYIKQRISEKTNFNPDSFRSERKSSKTGKMFKSLREDVRGFSKTGSRLKEKFSGSRIRSKFASFSPFNN